MEPTSLFVLYFLALSGLWLVASAVTPAIDALSSIGAVLPVGRKVAAFAVTAVLLVGVFRPSVAQGTLGPPSDRLVEMVADTIASDMSTTRPTLLAVAGSLASGAHVVESGESLWKIARQILTERGELASGSSISDLWHSIYELNRALIGDNPNLIHPGQVLQLPTG